MRTARSRHLLSGAMIGLTYIAAILATLPLLLILAHLLRKGASSLSLSFFTHRPRHVREERDRKGGCALHDQMGENEHQGQRGQNGGEICQTYHPPAHDVATARGSHWARLRATLHTSHRATAFTIRVMTNRIAPTAIKAER